MSRLMILVVVLCAAGAGVFAELDNAVDKTDLIEFSARQLEVLDFFDNIHEPTTEPSIQKIAKEWNIESNVEHFKNVTAAKTYAGMLKNKWYLPRAVPFSVDEPAHAFEAMTLFHVLYSAKDFDTFFKTAAYLKDTINEGLYVYALSIAMIYRKDTRGFAIPPIYQVFPSYFNEGEIMVTAQRINTHGKRFIEQYPSTYIKGEDVVINASAGFFFDNSPVSYFTNDYDLNAAHYFMSLVSPYWLSSKVAPVISNDIRGEVWWYAYRQLVARYYMERLSNDLGEIPEITNVVKDGYSSGLLYHNGIPFPSRSNNLRLDQSDLINEVEKVKEFENRIIDAIDKGYFVNRNGEHVSLLTDSGINTLGRLIESNAESPNRYYYKDFIRLWKKILGNSNQPGYQYANYFTPIVVPSALENYQTALRDPAFYMIWKRILNLFVTWQKQMPLYRPEDLSCSAVTIENVDVEKLVTFFEYSYMDVSSHLFQNKAKKEEKNVNVLVQRPRLNHQPFNISVHVKSDVAKKVLVKFFLAPKYDSNGFEIPLHHNTENFFMLDQFAYDLAAGENVITRASTDYLYTAKEPFATTKDIYDQVNRSPLQPTKRSMSVFPHRLLLPKGKVGGMTFKLVVYIQDFDGVKVPYTPGYHITGYPSDRPLYSFQVKNVKNLYFKDVLIYHESNPEAFLN